MLAMKEDRLDECLLNGDNSSFLSTSSSTPLLPTTLSSSSSEASPSPSPPPSPSPQPSASSILFKFKFTCWPFIRKHVSPSELFKRKRILPFSFIFLVSLIFIFWQLFPQFASFNEVKCFFRYLDQDEWIADNAPPLETVHIIWNPASEESNWFQFRHLLSLYSVAKYLEPMRIYIHYSKYPRSAPTTALEVHYDWLSAVQSDVANLEFVENKQAVKAGRATQQIIHDISHEWGSGVFMLPNTVLAASVKETLKDHGESCLLLTGYQLVIVQNRNALAECNLSPSENNPPPNPKQLWYNSQSIGFILAEDTRPDDHFQSNETLSTLIRHLYYGTTEPVGAIRHPTAQIPAIAHLVWFGRLQLTFTQMVAIRSAISVGGASMVYIHGDSPPEGAYWNELKHTFKEKITHHPVRRPLTVYQVELKTCFQQGDVVRLEVLNRFGGFYMDFDLIITRPLAELLHYDAVIGPDWWGQEKEGAPLMSTAFLMSKPRSDFLRHLMDSYRKFSNSKWNYNCCILPRKVYQKHPDSIKLVPELSYQVWFSSLKRDLTSHSTTPWQQYYSYHFERPEPEGILGKELTRSMADTMETTFGDIIRFVLYGNACPKRH